MAVPQEFIVKHQELILPGSIPLLSVDLSCIANLILRDILKKLINIL